MSDTSKKWPEEKTITYFNPRICVIGLGNAGLSLANLFTSKYKTLGFDLDKERVDELRATVHNGLYCTSDIERIRNCNFYVIAVPVPVDRSSESDLQPLLKASEIVGKVICGGDIVVYDSALYSGVVEEECIPVVEKISGLTCNINFFAGCCSGDRKITSGCTPEIGKILGEVYASVITADT